MSHAYLILCHTPPYHVAILAAQYPDQRYYIHYDLKSSLSQLDFLKYYKNIHILNNRIDVNWGGFSMILATLNLFQAALADPYNRYFHLMSGNCIPLVSPEFLSNQFAQYGDNILFLQCDNVPRLRHRVRFNAPHADTRWQRNLIGKILTKTIVLADKIIPSSQIGWQGAQWFSADRIALQTLFNESLNEPTAYFSKKLVPDEHFFQYIVKQQPHKFNLINNNKRYIKFLSYNCNNPIFLSTNELIKAKQELFWFARKVKPKQAISFIKNNLN